MVHESRSQSTAFHTSGRYGLLDIRNESGGRFRPARQLPLKSPDKTRRLSRIRVVEALSIKVLRKLSRRYIFLLRSHRQMLVACPLDNHCVPYYQVHARSQAKDLEWVVKANGDGTSKRLKCSIKRPSRNRNAGDRATKSDLLHLTDLLHTEPNVNLRLPKLPGASSDRSSEGRARFLSRESTQMDTNQADSPFASIGANSPKTQQRRKALPSARIDRARVKQRDSTNL